MVNLAFVILSVFAAPAAHGPFEAAGLFFVRVTAIKVPDHPKLLGDTTFRIDDVLVGPKSLKDKQAIYRFFTPKAEMQAGTMGHEYSGYYTDFAYPAAKGQSRYWWASPDGKGGWMTASFQKLAKFIPPPGPELLLKSNLKERTEELKQQEELIDAILQLDTKRTRIEQIAVLRKLQESQTKPVYLMADRTLKNLMAPPKSKKSIQKRDSGKG